MIKTKEDLIANCDINEDEAEAIWEATKRMDAAVTALCGHPLSMQKEVTSEKDVIKHVALILEEAGRIEQRKLLAEIRDAILAPPLIPTSIR